MQSERRYALAQRAAHIGSWDWDIATDRIVWSEQIEALFGLAPGQFAGQLAAFLERVHPEDRPGLTAAVKAAVEGSAPYAIEHRIVRPDGGVRWMAEQAEVERDASGRAVRLVGIVQDITRRKEAEQSLRESEQRIRTLIASLPGTAVFVVDRDLRYQLADGEALQAAGFRPWDLVGKTVSEALEPALADAYEPHFRRALAGESYGHEHEHRGRFYFTRGAPLLNAAGEVYAALAVSHDITERQQVEQRLA